MAQGREPALNGNLWLVGGLALLSFLSGMLGMGVGLIALPFLGFFFADLVNQVQPLSLLLNGVTAASSLIGFAQSGLVAWKPGLLLALTTTLISPLGAALAQHVDPIALWIFFFLASVCLAYRLLFPSQRQSSQDTRSTDKLGTGAGRIQGVALSLPAAFVGGMLGVGPGAVLMPLLILMGFEARSVAAMNSLVVIPSSFSALFAHRATARIDLTLAGSLSLICGIAALLGARFTAHRVSGRRLEQLLGLLILLLAAGKCAQMLFP